MRKMSFVLEFRVTCRISIFFHHRWRLFRNVILVVFSEQLSLKFMVVDIFEDGLIGLGVMYHTHCYVGTSVEKKTAEHSFR